MIRTNLLFVAVLFNLENFFGVFEFNDFMGLIQSYCMHLFDTVMTKILFTVFTILDLISGIASITFERFAFIEIIEGLKEFGI